MNRTGMGLAIGAGYLLGRTKKLKMALAVGGLVAGKKLNLSPRAVADLVSQQLRDNPQFKELGDQLRGDLRGVGKAASGALVERQISSLADRLHGRTAEVRGRLDGGGEDRDGTDESAGEEPYDEETDDREPDDREPDDTGEDRDDDGGRGAGRRPPDGEEGRQEGPGQEGLRREEGRTGRARRRRPGEEGGRQEDGREEDRVRLARRPLPFLEGRR